MLASDAAEVSTQGYLVAAVDSTAERRFESITELAHDALRALPPAGIALYRAKVDAQAAQAATDALVARDLVACARAFERWPLASSAPGLLQGMSGLAIARGQPLRARWALERLLDWYPTEAAQADARGALARLPRPPARGLEQPRGGADNRACREAALVELRGHGPALAYDDARRSATSLAVPPLVQGGRALLADADALHALDVRARRPVPLERRPGPRWSGVTEPPLALGGVISSGLLVAPVVAEVLHDTSYRGIPITVRLPLRRLAAFDLSAGRWRWDQRDLAGGWRRRWSFAAPPAAEDGVLYAPAAESCGTINAWLCAVDASSGALLWNQWLQSGTCETTMYGELVSPFLCSSPAVVDGVVYHATSVGGVAAVDVVTGRPRWLVEHPALSLQAAGGYYASRRTLSWREAAPLVEGGLVVVAPLDAGECSALDAGTGELRWRTRRRPHEEAPTHLHGVGRGGDGAALVLLSGERVEGLELATGRLRWSTPLDGVTVGRGWIAGGTLLVPVAAFGTDRFGVRQPVGPVWLAGVALDTGAVQRLASTEVSPPASLALDDELLVVSGQGSIQLFHAARPRRAPRRVW